LRQALLDHLDDLHDVANLLKSSFVGKDQVVDLLLVCAIAQEHLLVVGPPGTGKSELVKRFALLCTPPAADRPGGDTPYFEYLLTRFTEPNEIFGPVDIRGYQEQGIHRRLTDGMLPRAEIAFLDEIFKANSAILNALLTILNERFFYNAGRPVPTPLLTAVGATNEVPEDAALAALYDRFLVRVWSDNVDDRRFDELFQYGWRQEKVRIQQGYKMTLGNVTTTAALRELYRSLDEVDLGPVAGPYREVVRRVRSEGIELSDRRVIKLLKLIAAAALLRRRQRAEVADFWVLRHVWNREEQIPHLEAILDPYLEAAGEPDAGRRRLEQIENELQLLAAGRESLASDADFADFLHRAERLRRELQEHDDQAGREPLLQRLHAVIDEVMQLLAEEE